MHYQVPQYLDVEDKIIGPFTLKQFIYLLIGGGMIFLLFNVLKFSIFIIVAIPIGIFTLLIAFYKIGSQKFTQFISSFLGFISKPNVYIWKKRPPKRPDEASLWLVSRRLKPTKTKKPPEDELEETQWRAEINK